MANYDEQGVYRTQTGARSDAHLIDEGLRSYMLRVYNMMALGVAFTAIVALLTMNSPTLVNAIPKSPVIWILFAAIVGMGFFAHKLIFTGNTLLAHAAFWTYAGLWGLWIAPTIMAFLAAGAGSMVVLAFAITSVTFGATSLFGYVTKKDLSPMGTFLFMAAIGLIVAMVANYLFFQSQMMSLIVSCLVVIVFSAVTAYETQAIKEAYYAGDDETTQTGKAIFGAFLLYGSFMTLFVHILNILGIMSGDD